VSDFLTTLRSEVVAAHARRRRPATRARLLAQRGGRPALGLAAVLAAIVFALVMVRTLAPPTPARPHVLERLQVGGTPVDAVFDGRTLWVGDGARGRLAGIDPDRRRIAVRSVLPGPVVALAADPVGGRWVRTGLDASTRTRISWVDPASGAPSRGIVTGYGTALAVAGRTVWSARVEVPPEGLEAFDARTGARLRRLPRPSVYGLLAAGGDLWALVVDGTVLRLDARSGRLLRRFPQVAAGAGTGGDGRALAADAGGAWVVTPGTGPGDGALLRLGRDGQVRRFPVGGDQPLLRVVARAPDGVWTAAGDAARGDHRLLRLDPRTGRVTARVDLGDHRPVRLTAVGEELWVTCQDGAVLVVGSSG
jgi:hypothetical protein